MSFVPGDSLEKFRIARLNMQCHPWNLCLVFIGQPHCDRHHFSTLSHYPQGTRCLNLAYLLIS